MFMTKTLKHIIFSRAVNVLKKEETTVIISVYLLIGAKQEPNIVP